MKRRAFSLIELVIVVVIIGILAGIASSRFNGFADRARTNAAIANLQALERGAARYLAEHGSLPASGMPGKLPAEFDGYIDPRDFSAEAVGGGEYSWQEAGGLSGIVITASSADEELWKVLDIRLDDANQGTGKIRYASGIFAYFVNP